MEKAIKICVKTWLIEQIYCVPTEANTDQPGHPLSLIWSVFDVCVKKQWILRYPCQEILTNSVFDVCVKKQWILSYSHFFQQKFQHICVSLNVNLNELLDLKIPIERIKRKLWSGRPDSQADLNLHRAHCYFVGLPCGSFHLCTPTPLSTCSKAMIRIQCSR